MSISEHPERNNGHPDPLLEIESQIDLHERTWRELIQKWESQSGQRWPSGDPQAAAKAKTEFPAIDIWEMSETYPTLREPVIDGLLRQGESMGIHAKSKVGKSWTAYGLAMSIISKSHWLGKFACTPGNVLLIDNELHPENLASRIPRTVANAMHLTSDMCRGDMKILPLRGKLKDVYGLRKCFEQIPHGHYSTIIIDAFYRILPKGISENDNAAMAEIFNLIDAYAEMTGAAFILIHHATKGSQSEKDVVDVGSGAGSISRAVDTHMVLRPHEEDDHVVLDAKVRSFAPVNPIVLEWQFPLWQPVDLDPKQLKGRKTPGEEKQSRTDEDTKKTIGDVFIAEDEPLSIGGIRKKTGFSEGRVSRGIRMLIADGSVISHDTRKHPNGSTYETFKLSD